MGTIIEHRKMPDNQTVYQLMIYDNVPWEFDSLAVSINRPLSAELLKYKLGRRTMQLEKCLIKLLLELPDDPIIKDIDVMFNPIYKVDVMKILVSAYKKKPYSLIWPGKYADGKLIYSEENHPDYQVYEISNYDIMCVI